ncbi:MAG: hypothetical protein CL609_01040 [Anaerolineaceae bacterium]|nr:hypothetical protein [Anaerolineaceae bacterium]
MKNNLEKRGISSGIFLIGLGILAFTNQWWPGILFVIGLASSAELVMRGKYLPALITFGLFSVLSLFVVANIQWSVFGPFILIVLGALLIIKRFTNQHGNDNPHLE